MWECRSQGGLQTSWGSEGHCLRGTAHSRQNTTIERYVDHQVLRPVNVFRYIQTVDGRFSDSSGILMKYFDHV